MFTFLVPIVYLTEDDILAEPLIVLSTKPNYHLKTTGSKYIHT